MKPLFSSLRNVVAQIGLLEKAPFGESIRKTWEKEEGLTENGFGGTIQFTLKDIYYKDDYSCGYELKKDYSTLVVKYEAEILEAEHPISGEFLNLYLAGCDETACEIMTGSLRKELGYDGVNSRFLGKGESMELVSAYPVQKKMLEKRKPVALFPITGIGEEGAGLCTEFVIPLEYAEDLTGKPIR